MQAYMKSAMPYRGVTSAPLRVILHEVIAAHPLPDRASWEATVRQVWDGAEHREERYAALAVAGAPALPRRTRTSRRWTCTAHLVVAGAWWDVVDDLATPSRR